HVQWMDLSRADSVGTNCQRKGCSSLSVGAMVSALVVGSPVRMPALVAKRGFCSKRRRIQSPSPDNKKPLAQGSENQGLTTCFRTQGSFHMPSKLGNLPVRKVPEQQEYATLPPSGGHPAPLRCARPQDRCFPSFSSRARGPRRGSDWSRALRGAISA